MGVEKRKKNSPLRSNSLSNIIFDKSFPAYEISDWVSQNPSRVTITAKGFLSYQISNWVSQGANIIK